MKFIKINFKVTPYMYAYMKVLQPVIYMVYIICVYMILSCFNLPSSAISLEKIFSEILYQFSSFSCPSQNNLSFMMLKKGFVAVAS